MRQPRNGAMPLDLAQQRVRHALLGVIFDSTSNEVITPTNGAVPLDSVAVDNAVGADTAACGAIEKPCKTIRFGVSRALPGGTVTVRGSTAPYLGECGGGSDALSLSRGVQLPGTSLTVTAATDGPVAIIDCQGQGRAFSFNAASTPVPAGQSAAGATLRLVRLEVRNAAGPLTDRGGNGGAVLMAGSPGDTLLVEKCAFVNCHSPASGGALAMNDAFLSLTGSSFVRCTATEVGGGAFVNFVAGIADRTFINVDGCNFTNIHTAGTDASGGAMYVNFDGTANSTLASVRNSRFTNISVSSAAQHGGNGGALYFWYRSAAKNASTVVDTCDFKDIRTSFNGGGISVTHIGHASNTSVLVRDSQFANTEAGRTGGALAVEYLSTDGAATHVLDCAFANTSGTGTSGGAVSVFFSRHALRSDTLLQHCSFVHAVAGEEGGGAAVTFYSGASGAITNVVACKFVHTSAGFLGGGGLKVNFNAQSANVTTVVADSVFDGAIADGASGGGGAFIEIFSSSLNVDTRFLNTSFSRCISSGAGNAGGGGLYMYFAGPKTASPTLRVEDSRFHNNVAADGGNGGGIVLLFEDSAVVGASLMVQRSTFDGNTAAGVGGGGGLSIRLPLDATENLRFVGNDDPSIWVNQSSGDAVPAVDDDRGGPLYPYPMPVDLEYHPCAGCGAYPNGCTSCPEWHPYGAAVNPVAPLTNVYRRWTESNSFAIRGSTFRANTAIFQGGAIAVPSGGSGTIEGTTIAGNDATTLFGGGVFVGGTVRLRVENSSLESNTCGQRGCQLFSSSGAGMDFANGTIVELSCSATGECSDGFSAAQVGNVTWSGGSALACAAGFQLLDSSALDYPVTMDSWKLEPPSVFPEGCDLGSASRKQDSHHRTPFHSNCTIVQTKTNCPCYYSQNPYGGYYSAGNGPATVVPTVLVSTLSYACRACPRGAHSPLPPMLGGRATNETTIGTCLTCPYGSRCEGGGMVATRGFWGSSSGELSAFRCPTGYCCGAELCDSINGCSGNRSGVLCGDCAPGFVQTIGSTACRATVACGAADAAWFIPGALLLAVLYALFVRDKGRAGARGGWPLNAVQPIVYFYQIVQLLPVGTTATGATVALLNGLFSMQLRVGGGEGFACPFPALTTLQAIELEYAVPALIAALLALGFAIEAYWHRARGEKARLASNARSRLSEEYQVAWLKAATFAFSTLLTTTFSLLHCVDLRPVAGSSMLFRAATQACGAWQVPLYLLAAALLLPVAAGIAASTGCARTTKPLLPPAVVTTLRAPFRDGCAHWEAVLALHRLVVVAVYSFVSSSDSAVAAVLQALVCCVALVVHVAARPYRETSTNRVQTALLSFLVVVALLNVPQAAIDTNAATQTATMARLVGRLQGAEAALLLAPACLALLVLLFVYARKYAQLLAARAHAREGEGSHKVDTASLEEALLPASPDDTTIKLSGGARR